MRATARKRRAFMTTQRWVFVIVASMILLATVLFIYFRDIQQSQWTAKDEARKQAVEAADLVQIEKIYEHIWNKKSWIVQGSNELDEELFVFLAEEQLPDVVKAADGVSAEQISNTFNTKKPNAAVLRIQPGLLNNTRIWEVYYSESDNPKHYYYDFYSFVDGAFIDSYKLPAKTEP